MELLALLLKEVPAVISMVRAHHAQVNPSAPPLTDAEAVALFKQAIDSGVFVADQWLAAHRP